MADTVVNTNTPDSDLVENKNNTSETDVKSLSIRNGEEKSNEQCEKSREDLLLTISTMEADRKTFIERIRAKMAIQENKFEISKRENEILKERVKELEGLLRKSNLANNVGGNNKKSKQEEHTGELLTKAKTLLFEKTKICKQQEQQLNALNTQVEAVKDVLAITKEMLNLRNIENSHFQARFDTLELRLKGERERLAIGDKKLEMSNKMYEHIKAEYELQSNIFQELRQGYERKIELLTDQIETLKS